MNRKNRRERIPPIVLKDYYPMEAMIDAGDYFRGRDGRLYILAHPSLPFRSRFLVLYHELIEAILLMEKFGFKEFSRIDGRAMGNREDLYAEKAYRIAHKRALRAEKALARKLNIDWKTHMKNVDKVEKEIKGNFKIGGTE